MKRVILNQESVHLSLKLWIVVNTNMLADYADAGDRWPCHVLREVACFDVGRQPDCAYICQAVVSASIIATAI
jgi:hypothetical protein